MEDTAIPYELPEVENHSFFFIDQRVTTSIEAKPVSYTHLTLPTT